MDEILQDLEQTTPIRTDDAASGAPAREQQLAEGLADQPYGEFEQLETYLNQTVSQ